MMSEDDLQQEIEREVNRCVCKSPMRVQKVGNYRYRFGDKNEDRLVRCQKNTVSVRASTGWVTLNEFLRTEDPCRVAKSSQSTSRIYRLLTYMKHIVPFKFTSRSRTRPVEALDVTQEGEKDNLQFAGVVSGEGLLDKLVHTTDYKACIDCGQKTEHCKCGWTAEHRVQRNMPSEIKNDPRLLSLYTEALTTGQNKDCFSRVNVVGNFKQGKTTLVRRLVEKGVDTVESTNGIDVDTYICKRGISGKVQPKDGYTENAGMNFFKNFRRSDQHLIKEGNKNQKTMSNKPLLVNFWDFGGQYIFYATHTIFHSSRAIYILVLNLSEELGAVVKDEEYPDDTRADRNVEYFVRFWMNSIHSFVGSGDGREPPVILVGTHLDMLPGSPEEKRRQADRYFERVRRLFDGTQTICHILPMDFAVDNTDPSDSEIERLRDEIFCLGSSTAETYDIPAKWKSLEDALKKKKHLKIVPFITIADIDKLNEFPLKQEVQIKLFLQYHHAKGTLVYFDEDPLSNYVVLDVQYLIDAFKCIITSERFCSKDVSIRPLWRKLTTEARLEMDLIDKLWGNDISKNFLEHKTVLLAFLKKHHIISEVLQYDEKTGQSKGMGWFVVPSLLKCPFNRNDLRNFLTGKTQTTVRLVVSFDCSSVVHTIYHRLLAAALGRWPVANITCKPLLYENVGVFLVSEDHAGIAEINGESIDLRVVNLCVSANIDTVVADQFRRFADSFFQHEFRKLQDHDEGETRTLTSKDTIPELRSLAVNSSHTSKPQISAYRCNHEHHGLDGSVHSVVLARWKDKKLMPCPDNLNHEINVGKARSEWFQEDGMTENIPDTKLNEKHLSKLAQAIGRNWEALGCELGLSIVQIDHITEDNRSVVMKIFAMLRQWQCQEGESATMYALVGAIQRCKVVRADWDKIRNLIDELI